MARAWPLLGLVLTLPLAATAAEGPPPLPLAMPQAAEQGVRAQVRAKRHAVLSAGMAGRLTEMPAEVGRVVDKGALLAAFDCAAEEAERAEVEARLAAARTKLGVHQKLAAAKNIGKVDIATSRAEVGVGSAELRRIDALLRHCHLTAPFSGMIVERQAQAHEYVALGAPLLELIDLTGLEIEMVVPSGWISRLQPGLPFILHVDETGESTAAIIDRLVDVIDPVSQTMRVIGRLTVPAETLRPGMSGHVTFADKTPPSETLSQ